MGMAGTSQNIISTSGVNSRGRRENIQSESGKRSSGAMG